MSKEHPFILFVGKYEDGQVLAATGEARECCVLLPQDELESLAMYTVYFPDIIILDSQISFADEVHFHLSSIGVKQIYWLEDIKSTNPIAMLDAIMEPALI